MASLVWLGLLCLYHDVKPNWKRSKNYSTPTVAAADENEILWEEDVRYASERRARKQALKNHIRSMIPAKPNEDQGTYAKLLVNCT